jgi:Helix-turn-helix of DDE superfamily endonuclease
MTYEQVKDLKPSQFKRLCGVQPETFEQMVRVVHEARTEQGIGRPSKLSLPDQVLMTLEYWREYRTYFHIAQSWGVNVSGRRSRESTAYRIIRRVEEELTDSKVFSLPGKKSLLASNTALEVVVVDVMETPIERPKKSNVDSTVARKSDIPSKRRSS